MGGSSGSPFHQPLGQVAILMYFNNLALLNVLGLSGMLCWFDKVDAIVMEAIFAVEVRI